MFLERVLKYWQWPKFTYVDLLLLLVFIVILLLIFFILKIDYRRQIRREKRWFNILHFANEKRLSPGQIAALRSFFFNLPTITQKSLLNNKGFFRSSLYNFLEHKIELSSELKVQLLEKLFTEPGTQDNQLEIRTLRDLKEGELCSIEFKEEHHLGNIVEIEDLKLLFSIPEFVPKDDLTETSVKVYVYRPDIGGFLLFGKIINARKESIAFKHNGVIKMIRDYHLMAFLEFSIKIMSWPIFSEKEITLGFNKISKKKNIVLHGVSEKISDRGLTFNFVNEEDKKAFKKSSVTTWEIHLALIDGYEFICRGKILAPSESSSRHFIFKYVDASEEARKHLFMLIKMNNPVRENLY